jgi:hypothetical protein
VATGQYLSTLVGDPGEYSLRALDDGTVDHLSLEAVRFHPRRSRRLEHPRGPESLGFRWHESPVDRLDLLQVDAELPAKPEAARVVYVLREPVGVVERGGDAVERREDAGDARGQDEARAGVPNAGGRLEKRERASSGSREITSEISSGSSAFGKTTPASPGRATASRSSQNHGVAVPFTRTYAGLSGESQAETASRVSVFFSLGTASSRSRITASAPALRAFSKRSGRLPGTKR